MKKLLCVTALCVFGCERPRPKFADVGPRMVTNDTAFAVYLYGKDLPKGAKVQLGAPWSATLETGYVDGSHLTARLPFGLKMAPEVVSVDVPVSLVGPKGEAIEGQSTLTVTNDVAFPGPIAAVVAGSFLAVAVPETDEIWAYALASGEMTRMPAGDGPCALARYGNRVVVVDRYDGDLWILDPAEPKATAAKYTVGISSRGVAVAGDRAFVSDEVQDDVAVVDLKTGKVVQRIGVGVHPGPVAAGVNGKRIAVGNQGSGDVSIIYPKDLSATPPIAPKPGVAILGGKTEKYAEYVIGGKAPRDLAVSEKVGTAFEASIGPNVGPNPDKWEVSMNPGVGVIDINGGRFLRHVSVGYGTLSGLALDDAHSLLYATDEGAGRVVVFSADKLRESDDSARKALLGQVVLEPDKDIPLIRPLAELSAKGRGGIAVESGPKSIAIAPDGSRVYAVSRYDGSVWELDAAHADKGSLSVLHKWKGSGGFAQKERRLGQILYYSDVGHSGMTCDSCHFEGHDEGVLFAKTHPLRLYRVPTLRWIRESPPYFNPHNIKTLEDTVRIVMERNRYQNPPPSADEIKWLALFQKNLAGPPNPFVGANGLPPAELALPDGRVGHPAKGAAIFDGKGGCATSACHPAPIFTSDQNPETRGSTGDVGTPLALDVRMDMQDTTNQGIAPPALLGVWDQFPLFTSGAGGLVARKNIVTAGQGFALRTAMEMSTRVPHGKAKDLSPAEMDDLLAYLLTL